MKQENGYTHGAGVQTFVQNFTTQMPKASVLTIISTLQPEQFEVMVIEDETTTRNFVQDVVNGLDMFTCQLTFTDCYTALAALQRAVRPSVIFLDLHYHDGMKGIEMIEKIHALAPAANIIVMSCHYAKEVVQEVLSRGVMGFLCKPLGAVIIELALKNTMQGLTFFSKEVEHHFHSNIKQQLEKCNLYHLTKMERELLPYFAVELQDQEIAEKTFHSPRTIHNHKMNIYRKFGVHSLQELAEKIKKECLV